MDKSTAKLMREKLNAIFEEHGIDGYQIEIGNATFDTSRVTFKVEVRENGAGSVEERDLLRYADLYGLDTDKVTVQQGRQFTLHGYKTRARKNPWIVLDMLSQKQYVIGDDTAIRWFGKDVA
tara:strand:- start:4 stop:369 length:366 start_codon:yes stop_codon:yes gene_type:complete